MDNFGVQKSELKALARQPVFPGRNAAVTSGKRDTAPRNWLGASVRNVADTGEMSALGLADVSGVLVMDVPPGAVLAKCGLQKGDVILAVDGTRTPHVSALLQHAPALAHFHTIALTISRQQKQILLNIKP